MDKPKEAELFDSLLRLPRFREWVDEQLERQIDVLVVNPDMDAIHKAQGAAAFIKSIKSRLAAAESAIKRT